MKNKWIIGSLIVIVVVVVIATFVNVLSYEGEITTRAQSDYNNENNVHEVQLDYSLRSKDYQSFPFEVDKDKTVKFAYTFASNDNTIKVTIREAGSEEAVRSFVIQEKKGVEKVKLPKGKYTMDIIVPSLSEGSAVINWEDKK